MLSSIHPLGERSRQNRWVLTAAAFTIGSILSALAIAAAFGWIGTRTVAGLSTETAILLLGISFGASALLDAFRVDPPGPERQVNESWIGAFRGWVYGGAFGLQLGSGIATYVVTWSVYATFLSYLLLASVTQAALVGLVFGLGRSVSVIAAGYIDRPSRLTAFNRKLAQLGPPFRTATVTSVALIGVAAMTVGII